MAESAAYFSVKSISLNICGGRKPQTLMSATRHNLREIQAEHGADSHIDASRSKDNVVLFGHRTAKGVQAHAGALLDASKIDTSNMRRDYCQAIELVFSLPLDAKPEPVEYFRRCLDWIAIEMRLPVLSAVVHLDQAKPHVHVLLLPVRDDKYVGSYPIAIAALRDLRESFFNMVAGPAGLKRQGAKMAGTVKRLAVAAVLKVCEAKGVPQMYGALWPFVKGAIERDPTGAVQALEISDEEIRATPKEAPNPIGIEPNPIGFVESGKYDRTLSCVGFAQPTTSPSPQTQANHQPEPKESEQQKVLMSQNTDDASASQKAIDTMEALWAAVGCRSMWKTAKPQPATSITPPTTAAPPPQRLAVALKAKRKALDKHRKLATQDSGDEAAKPDETATAKSTPAPTLTTPTPRLEVARAAMEKAAPARKVAPVAVAQVVRESVPDEKDDVDGVVRVRDEDAHDLSAWDY